MNLSAVESKKGINAENPYLPFASAKALRDGGLKKSSGG